jgi:HlyD family secretion protein
MNIKSIGHLSRKKVVYGVLGLAVVVVAAFAFSSIYKTPASSSAGVARTVTVTKGDVQSSVSTSGNLSTVSTANENFVNSGTLTTLNAKVGQKVTAGEVLGTIDSSQESASLDAANSTLTVAKMNYTNDQTSSATLETSLKTAKSTLATDEGGGTTVQKDQNQSTLDSAEQQLTNDKNQLTTDTAQLATDEATLSSEQSSYSSAVSLGCPASPTAQGTSSGPSTGTATASAGAAPTVSTDAATSISATSAELDATINPNGSGTQYYFEYGSTAAYGLATAPVLMTTSGTTSSNVSVEVTGLSPNTTYMYEVVATNSIGSDAGVGVTFTTANTSCAIDAQAVSTDQATVTSDENALPKDQSAITVQTLAVSIAQQNVKPSSTSITSDKSAVTQAEASIAQNKIGLVQDQATIAQDELSVENDSKSLGETQLVALVTGTITAVNGSVGEVVNGGGSSTSGTATSTSTSATGTGTGAGTSLVTIQGLRQLQVVASIAEADAIKVQVHQTASITLPSLPNTVVRGVVTAIAPVSTIVSNVVTYPVTISVTNPPASLRDGMTADVSIVVQTATNVLELPSAAITTTGGTSTVEVLSKSGVQTSTKVTLGLVGTTDTQITSGVTEGETIAEPTASVSAATSTATPAAGGLGGGGRGFGGGAP